MLFTILNLQQQAQILQDRSTHSITAITTKIADKIDTVQNQTLSLLNSQGNLTANQRNSIIHDLQLLPTIIDQNNHTHDKLIKAIGLLNSSSGAGSWRYNTTSQLNQILTELNNR